MSVSLIMSDTIQRQHLSLNGSTTHRVRRRLFEAGDPEENKTILMDEVGRLDREMSRKYAFDFKAGNPLQSDAEEDGNCRYYWKRADAATTAATGTSWIGRVAVAPFPPSVQPICEQQSSFQQEISAPNASKQTKMTDFFSRRKRLAEEGVKAISKKMRNGSDPQSASASTSTSSQSS